MDPAGLSGLSYSSQRRRIRESVTDALNSIVKDNNDYNSVVTNDASKLFCESELPSSALRDVELACNLESGHDQFDNDPLLIPDKEIFNCSSENDLSDSSSSCMDTSDYVQKKDLDLTQQLSEWAVSYSVPLNTVSNLLSILKPYHDFLPLDARTLLKTPRNYEIKELIKCNGHYYHFGIASGLLKFLQCTCDLTTLTKELVLQFNIDGLPLFKSSSTEFWTILGLVKSGRATPFIIGVFCGKHKPKDVSEFLNDFIQELQLLLSNGLEYKSINYRIVVNSFVCDAPARSYLKNIKSHCAYFGCEKCKQEGEYINGRMTFPETNAALRTDDEFKAIVDDYHHNGLSPLSVLPIGLVTCFPLDYMHLVCLGVVRRMIKFWTKGPVRSKVRLSAASISVLSSRLAGLANKMPCEFARKPRGFSELDRWKAVEFRQLLLYSCFAVFPGALSEDVLKHFLLLCVGIRILVHPGHVRKFNGYAHDLLKMFVEQSRLLYGDEFVVYNVHCLIHLASDALIHGNLDAFSAFPFENHLKSVKRMIKKSHQPLPQLVRRISEQDQLGVHVETYNSKPKLGFSHSSGPVPDCYSSVRQYHKLETCNMCIKCDSVNDCIIIKGVGPAIVRNIILTDADDLLIIFEDFQCSEDCFSYPLPSSRLGIFLVEQKFNGLKECHLSQVTAKCVKLPYDQKFIMVPIIHTDKY